jgi:TetR/AcrR family transcriptional regulator, transcriptional repressor of bet genes
MARSSNNDERRAQIATALLAVMAKRGYEGATIVDIAAKARLAPGLVHYHFDTKLEILEEATRILAAEHDRALDTALAKATTAAAMLETFIEVHLGLGAHADAGRLSCWVQIAGEAIRHPSVRTEYAVVIASLAKRAERTIRRGIEAGELACDNPAAAAAAIAATIQGYFVMAATARELIPRGTAAASTRAMLDGLVHATKSKARAR